MTPDCTSAVSRGTIEDRISGLPRNIIDYILEFLPIRDAARTSVLSKQWRQKWAMLPCLVLDKLICDKLAVKSLSVFKETVDEILLQHIGDIVKFVLDVSGIHLSSYADIDRWMRNVTRNGVEMLILKMSKSINAYKLPSYLFDCPTLSNLVLSNCVFKPPNSFVCFQTLTTLAMLGVTFVPTIKSCVVDVPLLVNLTLIDCDGTQYLKIISPQLDTLAVEGSHGFFLYCFMNCTKLRVVILVVDNPIPDERSSLEKLLSSSAPTLKILHLCSVLLELLSADRIPKGPPFILNCLWHLSLDVDFGKLIETSCALQIITSAPQLSKLTVSVGGISCYVYG